MHTSNDITQLPLGNMVNLMQHIIIQFETMALPLTTIVDIQKPQQEP
jgi:hypothetical protein